MSGLRKSGLFRLVALVAMLAVAVLAARTVEAEPVSCTCTYGQWVEIYYYNNGAHSVLVGYESCYYCWGEVTPYYAFVNGCPNC